MKQKSFLYFQLETEPSLKVKSRRVWTRNTVHLAFDFQKLVNSNWRWGEFWKASGAMQTKWKKGPSHSQNKATFANIKEEKTKLLLKLLLPAADKVATDCLRASEAFVWSVLFLADGECFELPILEKITLIFELKRTTIAAVFRNRSHRFK